MLPWPAWAQTACVPLAARLVSVEGEVSVQPGGTRTWRPVEIEEQLCEGYSIRVGERSRAALALVNDAVLRLDQNTTLQLVDIAVEPEEQSLISLVIGAFQSFSRRPRMVAVDTPYLNATIEGTEFVIRADGERSELVVLEGIVTAANEQGTLRVPAGEAAVAEAGQAPRPAILVRPRDAVQWALYYPPLLGALGGAQQVPADLPAPLAEALRQAGRGDTAAAFRALDQVPPAQRDARYLLHRAAILLSVGRVDEARADIDRALASEPGSGLGHALRAVIGVAQNEREAALADGRRAVELSPDSSASHIALSYAQQSLFQLEAARDTMLAAVERQPGDALAWARLAELWLALGERGRAREAADRAAALAPDLAATQSIRGFAALAEFRTDIARAAFSRAIELQPADPMPRLGLGLAKIRESFLEEGRGDIDVAVALDPNRALLRSYLGKAYFEERRAPRDAEQLAIAKELDPLDPTPFLYDAIRKQTENRPVEALADLQRSIELNDNRAVYRSRLLLDADRAARGASIGRVYEDLGFHALGINEAGRSLAFDPGSAAAHRFLSDVYAGVRRREISRVSELLQAQLLQDININPVQPSISETNLNLVTAGGPADAGFNEFTPLFERNQLRANVSGLLGTDDTIGGEAVVSMLQDRVSLSAGAFGYRTDGWRDNNDLRHQIYNFFAQAALTPELNAQLELRRRETREGDLAFNFDPDDFVEDRNLERDQTSARVGVRWSPAPHSDFLFSAILSERDEEDTETQPFFLPGFDDVALDLQNEDQSYQLEGQYLFRSERLNLIVGGGYTDIDRRNRAFIDFPPGLPFPLDDVDDRTTSSVTEPRGYGYLHLNLPDPVVWTVGLAYNQYNDDPIDDENLSPKLGVTWNATRDLVLRAAWFQTTKPALANNRLLEPTQVAGFNQFFDDLDGADTTRYGVGLDWRVMPRLWLGAEATWRDV
ncbi:MAG TPA: TonB-dependent receptor, partial [Geminicoccaceae bacterium]|nr:TonB-dependent receptor [Geminicoccaceae bacterium]